MQAVGTVVAPARFDRVFPCDDRSVGRCLEITKRFVPSRTAEARAGGTGKVDESRLFCSSNLRGECLTCGPRCSSCFVWGRTSSTCHLPCLCKSSCPWLRLRRRQIPSSCDGVSGRQSRQKACWTITGNKCSTFFFTGYRLESGDTILATSTTTEFRLDWTCEANLDILRAFSAAADFLAWKSVMWASAIRALRRLPFDRYSPYSADAIS